MPTALARGGTAASIRAVEPTTAEAGASASLDEESAGWLASLSATGAVRDEAVARLHALLVRVCRKELSRRADPAVVPAGELADLAVQAGGDATVAVLAKLASFRGESRFTTWAYKFAVFEVSSVLGRRHWRVPQQRLDEDQWASLPDRLAAGPAELAEVGSLVLLVRGIVERELTPHQRDVFVALVVHGVPLDALVAQRGTNRNAVYKTMFDARRKIRDALVANGYDDPRKGAPR